ncbi:MAG TPA: TlpA disulfide reductase family protein [Pyrinomonadaceae bacterium]|nr:TlpA disulfide reductase family protein [Pyrinomonadaceae bacterium]
MKLFYFCLFTFAFCLFSACRPAAPPVAVSNKPVSINNIPQGNLPLPPLKNVENLGWQEMNDGTRQTLGELQNRVVVLDFWATYCPPCLEEIPHLVELQNKYSDLRVIGLHVGGEEDQPKVPEFAEKLKINYTLAYPDEELSDALLRNESAIPQTFVFDRTGKFVTRIIGFDEEKKRELDRAIEEALK